jgi:hypothetical protein
MSMKAERDNTKLHTTGQSPILKILDADWLRKNGAILRQQRAVATNARDMRTSASSTWVELPRNG